MKFIVLSGFFFRKGKVIMLEVRERATFESYKRLFLHWNKHFTVFIMSIYWQKALSLISWETLSTRRPGKSGIFSAFQIKKKQ